MDIEKSFRLYETRLYIHNCSYAVIIVTNLLLIIHKMNDLK